MRHGNGVTAAKKSAAVSASAAAASAGVATAAAVCRLERSPGRDGGPARAVCQLPGRRSELRSLRCNHGPSGQLLLVLQLRKQHGLFLKNSSRNGLRFPRALRRPNDAGAYFFRSSVQNSALLPRSRSCLRRNGRKKVVLTPSAVLSGISACGPTKAKGRLVFPTRTGYISQSFQFCYLAIAS